eukprot:905575_1
MFAFLLLLFPILDIINAEESIRYKPQLTFLGDEKAKKKPLYDYPIIRDNSNIDAPYPVRLTITPEELTTPNGVQNVNVNWFNSQKGSSSDWIAIYSPANATDTQYLDYFHSDGQTNGTFQVRVWNMRDSYQVRYFAENGNTDYILKGISNTATVKANQPLQAHISLTDNSPNEMQIRWVSSLIKNPTVKIGTTSGQYITTYPASSYTYDTTYMCGGSASIISPTQFRHPGYFYTVIAKNLKPDTKYYYIFGNDDYWSDEHSFTTSSADNKKPFQFIMYGDQGTYTNAFPTISKVESLLDDTDLVLHVGDISYAWGNGYTWEIWSNMIARVASSVPYMVSIGNHEYDHTANCNTGGNDVSGVGANGYHPVWGNEGDDSSGECGAPMYFRYNFSSNGNSIFWYSFNYNSAHFIMLSSEHNYSANAPGYNWLVNDLKKVDRTETPWVIVNIHRSLYESEIFPGDNIVGAHLVQLLEPTLYEYKVDMVLAGHYHAYERTCALYNYECIGEKKGGITHMTIGTGGIGLDNALYMDVDWSMFRDEIDWGFGRFFVNYTTIIAQFETNQLGVVDEVVLVK